MNVIAENPSQVSVPSDRNGRRARLIALYLPQYHPIRENDEWWGKGFTEWTNVAKAKPLFRGHHQPNVPADLGFYDLRVPETRQAQADLARENGIEAFCYWHYWFAGRQILERPFNEVLRSGEPDFPFCLGWANHTWSGIWMGEPNRTLIEQTYPGDEDHKAHFRVLLQAFRDPRYLRVDDKPVFLLFLPRALPNAKHVTDLWREMAVDAGLKGLHLIGMMDPCHWSPQEYGFDAATYSPYPHDDGIDPLRFSRRVRRKLRTLPITKGLMRRFEPEPIHVYRYKDALPHMLINPPADVEYYPCILPNWDNTPRSGKKGHVLQGSTPDLFSKHLKQALQTVEGVPFEHRIVMIKSWNEWAEGNYLEPDLRYGKAFLEVIKEQVLVT